jgi:sortase A
MKTFLKLITTIILLLLLLIPITYFLIYPNYNTLVGPIKRVNIQRSSEEIAFQIFTELSPTRDKILGVSDTTSTDKSLEDTISSSFILEEKLLEDINTKIKINSIEVEGNIFEGTDPTTMNKGFWHFPISQHPGQKGNSVIIGHRYAKLPPEKDTFFNLDKVKVGDRITVEQNNNEYTYIVTETKVVEKNDISVLQNFNDHRLTLITCTPLWTADQRLVIVGKLDKLYQNT